jgi:tRNA(His) 5'-end guanylyltransferase
MKYLCENIQGCVIGYTQSDEITLILIDYQTLTTSAWFDYEVQKLCSVGASMATMKFNQEFHKNVLQYCGEHIGLDCEDSIKYETILQSAAAKGAMFDCRCFNIPKEEVTNLILWRQLDATRNSIEMVGRAYFSHKELMYKNTDKIQDMLWNKFKINWNDFPTKYKRGSTCIKDEEGHWFIDNEMPILKDAGRGYVEMLINI